MSHNGNDSEFFKGFLFGGLVGAVIALLYAPKSGKEVREDIRKISADIKDDAEGKLELAQERAESLFEETKKQLEKLRKDAESALGEMKEKAAEGAGKSKATLKNEKSRISDAIDAGVSAYKQEKATKSKRKS